MFVRVKNRKTWLYHDDGRQAYIVGESGAVDASNSEKLIIITYENGKVKSYSIEGAYKMIIVSSNAIRASFQGGDIHVMLKDGTIEVRRSDNGGLIRKIH